MRFFLETYFELFISSILLVGYFKITGIRKVLNTVDKVSISIQIITLLECLAFALFLIWFTIFGVRELVQTREEKFRKWYEVEGKKLEKARREQEKLEKGEKTTTRVRKAMFKMVSVMTMGSISGVGNISD